jgi:hypothetical protein
MTVTRTFTIGLLRPYGIFVTTNGDVFVNDATMNGGVNKWSAKTYTAELVMSGVSSCYGLFVDINNTLYCSMYDRHKVVKKWLNDQTTKFTIAAGTDAAGSESNMLQHPVGIFVDTNFDLYVADCGNHRIQLFRSGQLSGTTAAGIKSLNTTITLNYPTGIVLDADKYLFIVDQVNHRIIGSGPSGFRCLVGCWGRGPASNQLNHPSSLSFDSFGNMYVTDSQNNRVQKFLLSTNSCGRYGYILLYTSKKR